MKRCRLLLLLLICLRVQAEPIPLGTLFFSPEERRSQSAGPLTHSSVAGVHGVTKVGKQPVVWVAGQALHVGEQWQGWQLTRVLIPEGQTWWRNQAGRLIKREIGEVMPEPSEGKAK